MARSLNYITPFGGEHCFKVAYICSAFAKALKWSDYEQEFCYYAGLIHDCGKTQKFIRDTSDTSKHCILGHDLLDSVPFLQPFAKVVRYHHSDKTEIQEASISLFERRMTSLLALSDHFEHIYIDLFTDNQCYLSAKDREEVFSNLLKNNSRYLFTESELEKIHTVVCTDQFWFYLKKKNLQFSTHFFSQASIFPASLAISDITSMCIFLARLIDASSHYTYYHSLKVALISQSLAKKLGLPSQITELIYIAGLVHDLGKIRVPQNLLNKKGKLTDSEYIEVRCHTIDTEIALKTLLGQSKVVEWATNHHELLDGSGYPYNKVAEELDLPSRIIAVGDIFQALVQSRPYRAALPCSKIIAIIKQQVDEGKLDRVVFQCLTSNIEELYALAR
ncbi:HD-GYP domain-containing protein [Vibrio vulnificus]|uniref:HD-GYP domain-containing protein n=1 Tax=Vibrio vulnificus TaxID=672 RepID=UPI001CDB75FC|nr:HD domain-containing phosphohydrolase [Vibrio vulnificus]